MKPVGPIPPGYQAIDGELSVDGRKLSEIADGEGTPLFVYSSALVRQRMALLRDVMPKRLRIHYAVKANPYRPLLELMRTLADGFDIASAGELDMALAAGQDPAGISFAGPGKRDVELELAIRHAVTLNLVSEGEARRA